jgi:hypothetical protein
VKRTLTRVSTLAKANDDASSLFGWKQEMVLRGLRAAPDLQAVLATMEADGPKDKYRGLARQAEERAAAMASANLGTAIHSAIETLVKGGSLDGVPESIRRDAEGVVRALDAAHLTVLGSEVFVANLKLEEKLGGSFDHLVRGRRGAHILDVKTGSGPDTPKYASLSWATQLACYAHGTPFVGTVARDSWQRPVVEDVPENYAPWVAEPSLSVGIVAHVVRGSGVCDLIAIDLDRGWHAAQVAVEVRALRKRGGLL